MVEARLGMWRAYRYANEGLDLAGLNLDFLRLLLCFSQSVKTRAFMKGKTVVITGGTSGIGKSLLIASASMALIAVAPAGAQADAVGAAFGAGTGLVVAGPPGAVVGAVVGAVWGHPFWGPPNNPQSCWIDNSFYRHCRYYNGRWYHY
jgi:hypothetical protein